MLHSLYRTKLLQVVLALSLDSSPVFTCFHEGKMPIQQSRNTCAGRVLKDHAGLPTSCFWFGSVSSSFPEHCTMIYRLQSTEYSYQRLQMKWKLPLVSPGHFLLLNTWSSREYERGATLPGSQAYQPRRGSTQAQWMCAFSAKAPQLHVCSAMLLSRAPIL